MIVDGVYFNVNVIKGMTQKAFIEQNIEHLWKGRDKTARRKMLEEVYRTINPPAEKTAEE